MKPVVLILSMAILLTSWVCQKETPKEEIDKDAPFRKDISGVYELERVEEIVGEDPLNGNPIQIKIEKNENLYHFTVIHKETEIGSFTQPFLNREFSGPLEKAESTIKINRDGEKGIVCQIRADNGAYIFNIYLKK